MYQNNIYYTYSEYLKHKYGVKVYKLPINLPVTCPNRIASDGCVFCAEIGTGFESLDNQLSVTEQLMENQQYIRTKYKAEKFIAYFQNFTNTFLPLDELRTYMEEAAAVPDIVEISISTRPDCISDQYLQMFDEFRIQYGIEIVLELGLQTVNYHTLDKINRGHSLAEFIDAAVRTSVYKFPLCTHVILNLPWDNSRDVLETAKILSALPIQIVKLHSLYVPKNTQLCKWYENGTITICGKNEYLDRLVLFIEHLRPDIVVERLFGRAPEDEVVFSNWNTSWRKLQMEFTDRMKQSDSFQGRQFHYLNGAALNKL